MQSNQELCCPHIETHENHADEWRRPWLDCKKIQADLNLCWTHIWSFSGWSSSYVNIITCTIFYQIFREKCLSKPCRSNASAPKGGLTLFTIQSGLFRHTTGQSNGFLEIRVSTVSSYGIQIFRAIIIWALSCENMSLGHAQTAKAQIRLHECAVWSGSAVCL